MKIRYLAIAIAASTIALGAASTISIAGAQNPALMATVAETAPLPQDAIPAYIKAAVNAPDRPAEDKELDAGRKPEQILAFFGIKPGMKVADIWAAGGWDTELLSRVVGPGGKVYSQNLPKFPAKYQKIADQWHARVPRLKNVVEIAKPFDAPDLLPVPAGSLDAVIINENYHDMVGLKMDRAKVNRQIFTALKPGGVYGIVDHSAQNGSGDRDCATLHRIDENFVINEIEKSGFELAESSSALRHPEDDRTWFVFKKRGQTDRFMLKFVKPR
ncbi:MAG: class I SAM-dependent methyltransferase [Candidatus Binataceae bacterium]